MAKVKLILDKRKNRVKKDGTYPLVLFISHKKKVARIVLKHSFNIKNWDEDSLSPVNVPNANHLGAKFRSQLSKADLLLSSLDFEIDSLSMLELKAMVEAEVFSISSTTQKQKEKYIDRKLNSASLTDYAKIKIKRLRTSHQHGNATAIETAIKSIKGFTKTENIEFRAFDIGALKNYCAYCYSRGNKPNTVGAYLRQIKALFNEAIDEGVIEDRIYPFRKFKIPKSPKTKNRALRLEEINKIRNLDLKEGSAIWKARNYFLFMFNSMGLNFIDLAKLQKRQFSKTAYDKKGKLTEGRISYQRSKTQGTFSIKLTAEALEILSHYDVKQKEPNDFIFPLKFENTEQGRKRYQQQRKRVNSKIRDLAKLAKIDEEVTTYFARHSWATIAKRKNMPVALISEGLGHADLKTTQTYLASFDQDTLDDANDDIVR